VRKERELIQGRRFAKVEAVCGREAKEKEWFDFVEVPKILRGDGMLVL
jgi:hypothetical protein